MSNKLSEQVSALMDDECTEHELKLAVRQLARDTTLASKWERYHLISDVLKGDTPTVFNADFAQRMRKLVDAEQPLATTHPPRQSRSWRRPALGLAVAASVAAMAVLVVQPLIDQTPADNLIAQQAEPPDTQGTSLEDDIAARMNAYMANHNSLASMNGVHGVLPYVRISNPGDGR